MTKTNDAPQHIESLIEAYGTLPTGANKRRIMQLILQDRKRLIERETELLDSLYWMYTQYCAARGHLFMGAGETASDLLEDAGYITVNGVGEVIKDNGDSHEQRQRIDTIKQEELEGGGE